MTGMPIFRQNNTVWDEYVVPYNITNRILCATHSDMLLKTCYPGFQPEHVECIIILETRRNSVRMLLDVKDQIKILNVTDFEINEISS